MKIKNVKQLKEYWKKETYDLYKNTIKDYYNKNWTETALDCAEMIMDYIENKYIIVNTKTLEKLCLREVFNSSNKAITDYLYCEVTKASSCACYYKECLFCFYNSLLINPHIKFIKKEQYYKKE